jgi:hypothetical protein
MSTKGKYTGADQQLVVARGQVWDLGMGKRLFFFLWWNLGLNLGLHTCKAGTLLLKPKLRPFCSGYLGDGVSLTIPSIPRGWSQTTILLTSASQVVMITGWAPGTWQQEASYGGNENVLKLGSGDRDKTLHACWKPHLECANLWVCKLNPRLLF